MAERWRSLASRTWVHCALLAVPYVVGVVVLKFLTVKLPVWQGGDEWAHYSAVLEYARQLPFVDLRRAYGTSSGPLMYYVYGAFTLLWGPEIFKLRLLNMLISYLTTVAMYFMLRRTLSISPRVSLALTAVVALSPYLFGQTFVVLTDNFMYLWVVLALDSIFRFVRRPTTSPLVVASMCIALATLTRQFAVWLVPIAALAVWRAPGGSKDKRTWLAIVAASCAPLALLMLVWGGVAVPEATTMVQYTEPRLPNLLQALAVIGLLTVTIVPLKTLRILASSVVRSPLLITPGLAALVGIWVRYVYSPPVRYGYLGLIAGAYPAFRETSLIYWLLAPIGAVFLGWAVSAYRADPTRWLAAIGLALIALTTMASSMTFQRYIDVPFLLCVAVLASDDERVHRLDLLRWWLLVAGFIGYVFVYAGW